MKRLYVDLAVSYIAEPKEHESVKTLATYRQTLDSFGKIVGKQDVEDITREDIPAWVADSGRTGTLPEPSGTESTSSRSSSIT